MTLKEVAGTILGNEPGFETFVHKPEPVPGLFPKRNIEEVQPNDWFEPAFATILFSIWIVKLAVIDAIPEQAYSFSKKAPTPFPLKAVILKT